MNVTLELFVEVPDRFRRDDSLRKVYRERRPFTVNALNAYMSAHHPQEVLRYRQAKTSALNCVVPDEVNALELLEQLGQVVFLDAYSRVRYAYHELNAAFFRHLPADIHCYAAFMSVLHGVVEDVRDNLPDSDFIAKQPVRQSLVNVHRELQVLLARLEHNHVGYVIKDGAQLVVSLRNLHLSGLDLAEV